MVIWIVAIPSVAIILVVAAIMFRPARRAAHLFDLFGTGKPGQNIGEINSPVGVTGPSPGLGLRFRVQNLSRPATRR